MSDKPETIIYVYETVLQSVARDVTSTLSLAALTGIGVALNSSAMQWLGFILASLWIIGRVTTSVNTHRVTPQKAADLLKETFGVTAK